MIALIVFLALIALIPVFLILFDNNSFENSFLRADGVTEEEYRKIMHAKNPFLMIDVLSHGLDEEEYHEICNSKNPFLTIDLQKERKNREEMLSNFLS